MLQFTFGGSSSSSMVSTTSASSASSSLDGAVDDNKPNSLYGGSATSDSAADLFASYGNIPMQVLARRTSSLSSDQQLDYRRLIVEDEDVEDNDEYDSLALRAAAGSATISRWEKNSGGVFDDASLLECAEPGGGGGVGSSGGAGRRYHRRRSRLAYQYHHHRAMGEEDGRQRDAALQAAADLQREVFPLGVPSQGVLKAGRRHISASLMFAAAGCERRPWRGFIVDDVLYVCATEFCGDGHDFRTAVMALMELAEGMLNCFSVLVALPKASASASAAVSASADAASLTRAFLYSGFELVSPMLYQPSPAYVLVGYDAM
ncbi:hypothetical protein H4R26_003074 [Coemansia thaxteri]|uniref:Ornithine decarboxylase antizyme n=1 Tax=Coemansia thaxteri TaxID=2663907 RepID=A0A9W8EJJ2_9FUNG|nr:hypothetical protein H4R26_003074 [Coemansia thaxteri]KAJ2483709.1 hypothetical protein EV174_002885 [Coemansia sp. RSA 2320]